MICVSTLSARGRARWDPTRHLGPRLPLGQLVKRQIRKTADFSACLTRPAQAGHARRREPDRLRPAAPAQRELVHDMPEMASGSLQRVKGYDATLAAGIPIFQCGEHTGAMPRKLVRAGSNGIVS